MTEQPKLISYDISVRDSRYTVIAPNGKAHFISPSTNKKKKIYIIKANHVFLYVGKTSQSMSARFGMGFNPKHYPGYAGYKWRKEDADFSLDVWHFEQGISDQDVETIESEVVFRCRMVAGYWPLGQNEIHFYELRRDLSVTADIIFSTSHGDRANYRELQKHSSSGD
jgi:hypothetical protein